jgi:ubiquinone/menaquinone biosynthesis C-methylase UbiE
MALFRISSPYGRMYSAFYDHFVSPAVFRVLENDLHGTFVKRVGPDDRILDIGCGGGEHAIELAIQRPDVHVVGIDLSAEFVRRARRRASAAQLGSRVEFVKGNALALPFEAEEFDHVYSFGSIKHWPNMAQGLAECMRVLKPGGQLLVGEADRGCRFPDVVAWTRDSRVPRPLHIVLHLYFRTFVAGQSIDLDDARELWTALALDETDGPRRILGTPALVMTGRKA